MGSWTHTHVQHKPMNPSTVSPHLSDFQTKDAGFFTGATFETKSLRRRQDLHD